MLEAVPHRVEVRKVRPAIVVSNDTANRVMNCVQVVPITSNVSRVGPAEALIETPDGPRKAMTDQITTISKERLKDRTCAIHGLGIAAVERALRVQLGLACS